MSKNLIRVIDTLQTVAARLAGALLLALIVVILFDVIGRNAFDSGSTQLQELEWHLNATIFLLTLGYAYTRQGHVRIEIFVHRFSNRQRSLIEACGGLLLALPYTLALILYGFDYTAASFAFNEASASATGLPYRWILKGLMVAGIGLLALATLAEFLRSLAALRSDGGAG